jgi:hypothetical protein
MPKARLKDPKQPQGTRLLDARPDRVDYRDLPYRARLVSLPDMWPDPEFIKKNFGDYAESLILDQGEYGACTGFGLSATVNYMLWMRGHQAAGTTSSPARRTGKSPASAAPAPMKVSAAMLYHMARIYDEWDGEDYEGSSCRGAMKGWHRHGSCIESLWPYEIDEKGEFVVVAKKGWQVDAALRPLGAYYRVDKNSIVDLQSAICEVGAVYVSAEVTDAWMLGEEDSLPLIPPPKGQKGGHAFALVGYTSDGFIVQNSWGPKWGYKGFAVLTFEDWIRAGSDAWVATLGAPVKVAKDSAAASARTRRSAGVRDVADGKATWFWSSDKPQKPNLYKNPKVEPWGESLAYEHSIVIGNDGEALNRLIDHGSGASAVEECAFALPDQWLRGGGKKKLAIYAHGGLNSEEDSLKRIRVMAPYFAENGIYPLFVTWKTGVWESITGMLADAAKKLWPFGDTARGLDDLFTRLAEARDRTFEQAARNVGIKALWSEMKQNAASSVIGGGGIELAAKQLERLAASVNGFELHLVGHSAGSILIGHLLDELAKIGGPKVATCTLYAPACTVEFANQRYGAAHQNGVLPVDRLEVHLMDDERERADSVAIYGKSLLYLVSRALETLHKSPILGLEKAWLAGSTDKDDDSWDPDTKDHVKAWQKLAGGKAKLVAYGKSHKVNDGVGTIPLAHGSFDNDVEVVSKTLERILGKPLPTRVEVLRGF